MRIDRLGLNVRARTAWEAVDLGFALGRHHASAWLAPWWLCGGLLSALLLAAGHALDLVWAVPFALWWLKPALDRLPLYVLSRAVFGRVPTRAEVWRAAWGWGWGAVWPRLLWLRFDPFRALSMPADLLEGLPRAERGPRRVLLRREGGGQALALWALMPWFEFVLIASVWSLMAMMIPLEWWEARGDDWFGALTGASGEHAWIDLVQSALACAALLAIEPFFVSAGFGLYLGRRVHLEAWDLELGFKRMAARAASGARALAAVLLFAVMGLGALPAEALAKDPPAKHGQPQKPVAEAPVPPKAAARKPLGASALPDGFGAQDPATARRLETALRRTRDDRTLGGTETVQQWRIKPDLVPEISDEATAETVFDWKQWLGELIGRGVGLAAQTLLWALALALFGWLLWRYRDWLPWRRDPAAAGHAPPPLRHRALTPEDVAAAPELLRRARAAWTRGEAREAFACLYRAGLREVSARRPRPLPPGTTEGELLRAAGALAHAPAAAHVQRLVRAWRGVAYAGARPDAAAFDALLAEWPNAFGEAQP
jgi:hypothetical protein